MGMDKSDMLDQFHKSKNSSWTHWAPVHKMHGGLMGQLVNDTQYCYRKGLLSLFYDVDDAPLKEGQSVFQELWVFNVEHEIHREGCYEGFIKALAPDHVCSVNFHHTVHSSSDGHFPVLVHKLDGWIRCSRFPLKHTKSIVY